MDKHYVADQHLLQSPPVMSGDWSEVYPATEVDELLSKRTADAAAMLVDKQARIAELEREITAITAQRDRVWSQLLDAREQIQRLTFGHSGN